MKFKMVATYTMEALAAVTLCCIVAVFVVAHYDQKVDSYNRAAIRTAKEAGALVPKFFEKNPGSDLSPEALTEQGLKPEEGVKVEVPLDNKKADNWKVEFWHQGGDRKYTINKDGLKEHLK